MAHSCLTLATGPAERDSSLLLVDRLAPHRRITLGADKGYGAASFVGGLRARKVTPHIAVDGRISKLGKVGATTIDARTTPATRLASGRASGSRKCLAG